MKKDPKQRKNKRREKMDRNMERRWVINKQFGLWKEHLQKNK